MIDPSHDLSITKQAETLNISRGSVYYVPRPVSALKAGVWFRRGRLLIVSPDSQGTACPLSGRNSTYRPVQILEAGSQYRVIEWRVLNRQE